MRITKSDIKLLRSLAQKKIRDREGKFLVEGWKALKEALESDFRIDFVAVAQHLLKSPDFASMASQFKARGIVLKELTNVELNQVTDTVQAQGLVALVHQKSWTMDAILSGQPKLVVLADRISDPGNLGTIVRTCDWFGVDALVLSEDCVDLYNEKVVRSTSGSIFHLPVVENADLVNAVTRLKVQSFKCYITAGDSTTSYSSMKYGEKTAFVLGHEATGVRAEVRQVADQVVGIPRNGRGESLNVAIACGIVLAHLRLRE